MAGPTTDLVGGNVSRGVIRPNTAFGMQRQCVVRNSNFAWFNNQSNGTDTSQTSRLPHTAISTCTNLRAFWGNYTFSPGYTSQPGPVTITASIEYPAGTFTQLTFGGSASATLAGGANLISDPCPIFIPAAATFWTRTCATVTSGAKFAVGWTTGHFDSSSGATANSDATLSGTISNSYSNVFGVQAVMGTMQTPKPAILLVGDSIASGTNDINASANGGDDFYGSGVLGRAFGVTSWPIVNCCVAGEFASTFANNGIHNLALLADACDYCVCELGCNDCVGGTLSTIQANLQSFWNQCTSRGLKVYQTTVNPRTTSTDLWITTANQTLNPSHSVFAQLNDWIRTVPAPLSGYFELADLWESSRNSGLVKPGALQVSSQSSGSNTTTSLNDTGQAWTVNQFARAANITTCSYVVQITGGTGAGQQQYILSNTATQLTLNAAWSGSTPDATSTYKIFGIYTIDGIHGTPFSYPSLKSCVDLSQFV